MKQRRTVRTRVEKLMRINRVILLFFAAATVLCLIFRSTMDKSGDAYRILTIAIIACDSLILLYFVTVFICLNLYFKSVSADKDKNVED